MNLPPLDLQSLLTEYHLLPKKSLGQNFLSDVHILERIVQAAEIPQDTCVLEIGAGLGSLTRYLAVVSKRVVAIEIDQKFQPVLNDVLKGFPNVTLLIGDILEMQPAEFIGSDEFLVVANIPYYITSHLIRHLLDASKKPQRLVLTVQKELANRICEKPGDLSLLALSVQVYGKPRIMMKIPAGSFYPVPKVDSAVVRVDLYPQPLIPLQDLELFFKMAKAGFNQKRKKMRNALADGLHIRADKAEELLVVAGIDPSYRAQMLAVDDWEKLTQVWRERQA